MDIQKQIDYWQRGSEEDMAAASTLLQKRHLRHTLFFAHLAIEKMLKAHVVRVTADIPPRIHDLLRLADLARIALPDERRAFLARFQQYGLAGRYPGFEPPAPSVGEAESVLREAQEVLAWLKNQLN